MVLVLEEWIAMRCLGGASGRNVEYGKDIYLTVKASGSMYARSVSGDFVAREKRSCLANPISVASNKSFGLCLIV